MSEIRNRIITISGEPASGKSTVIDKLKKDYEAMGYKVHIYSVGHEFRRLAQERELSVGEFNKFVSDRGDIDKLIDEAVAKRGEEINSKERPKEVFIFDSRLAFHNIPSSFSIRLTVDSNVAGQRVFGDNKRGKEDKYATVEEATEQTIKRKKAEIERYLKTYGVNLEDPKNYNLLIDTSFSSIEDIAKVIEQCLELEVERGKLEEELLSLREGIVKVNNKLERIQQIEQRIEKTKYAKKWTSPKTLLPLQSERQTYGGGLASGTLEEMVDKLRKDGYDPSSEIEIAEAYGRKYIIDGHHRNFAAAYVGNTLVPYITVAKDNESVPGYGSTTANMRASCLNKNYLFGHEGFFDKKDEKGNVIETFSYNHVYPGIYNGLKERDDWDDYR